MLFGLLPYRAMLAARLALGFDKQFARDWLTSNPGNDWTLPQEIVDKTIEKYLQAYKMLTGKDLD